ncbi:MAG: hypothetical protein N3D20_01665 [Candidatus Pacearchaeota archaeon]|nr:hypothetical protein [Candidatus Pacearchaeota archaeon]
MVLKIHPVRRIFYICLISIFLIILSVAIYTSFIYTPKCEIMECFKEYMEKCSKATYINEEQEASWRYEILGSEGKTCKIRVKILLAKEGELGIDKLVGKEMICYYPLGVYTYPERDLSKCHGLLKEEIQDIIINKLHKYLIENLGKVAEGLNKL